MPTLRKINVLLVHGTWSAGKWTGTDSDFRLRLAQQLAEIGLEPVYLAIPWTGQNRWDARQKVSQHLVNEIVQHAAMEHNGYEFLLVAHSHGGNIATNAAREVMKAHPDIPIKGVVCLNTPFLAREPRGFNNHFLVWCAAVLLCALAESVAYVLAGTSDMRRPWFFPMLGLDQVPPESLVGITVGMLLLTAAVLLALRMVSRDTVKLQDHDDWHPAPPTLCLSCPDDEAITLLGLVEGIANVPQLLMHNAWLALMGAGAIGVGLGAAYSGLCDWRSCASGLAPMLGAALALWISAALAAGLLGAGFVTFMFGLRKREVINTLLSRVLVSYTPLRPAQASFRGILELPGGLDHVFALSHSKIFESSQTFKEICAWIDHLDSLMVRSAWIPTVREAA